MLACFALPQQAAAQNSVDIFGSTVTISDADPVDEGGTARFEITIDPGLAALFENRPIIYTPVTAGLADLGSDRPATITFNQFETSATIEVPINDDGIAEGEETFTVTIDFAGFGTIQATGTINASTGTAPPPAVDISIDNASATEGGDIRFPVTLSTQLLEARTINVGYTAGSGNTGAELGDLGSDRPTTLTLPTGTTTVNLVVPTVDDTDDENDETFTVTLSEGTTSLPDGVTIGADNEATGTITDADTAGVSLSSTAPPPVAEGGTITFTVELDNPVAETFTLGWAASDGTATVEDDLDDQSGTVEIAANAETATFTIPVTNDTDIEDSETFTVALTGAPTGLVNIAPSRITVDRASATGTINASDAPDVNTVTIGNRTVAENVSGGSVGFTVSLTRAVDSDVTLAVAYTAGTATLADDPTRFTHIERGSIRVGLP